MLPLAEEACSYVILQERTGRGGPEMERRSRFLKPITVIGKEQVISMEDILSEEPIPGISDFWRQAEKDGTLQELRKLNNDEPQGLLGIITGVNPLEKSLTYTIGVSHVGKYPEQYQEYFFPAAKWEIIEVRGTMPEAMAHARSTIYGNHLNRFGMDFLALPFLEVFPDRGPQEGAERGEVWLAIQ